MLFACVDIGYGYVKYIDSEGMVQKFKAVVAELGKSMNEPEGCDIFTVDGVRYIVGDAVYETGKKPMVANESEQRAQNVIYKVLGLYALTKIAGDKPCAVVTGLPYQNMDEAEEVKKVFTGKNEVELNGEKITINVEDTKVVAQGYGTFMTLVKQRGNEVLKKKILLEDLGNRTTNHIPIVNGNIDIDEVKTSRQMGIQNAYIKLVNAANKEYNKNYKHYHVDDLLDIGVAVQTEKGKVYESIKNKDYVTEAFTEYAYDVWNEIYDKYDDDFLEDLDEVIFAGGTAERVGEYLIDQQKQFCSFMEDLQDAQVQGYGIIAEKLTAKASK